MDSLISALRLAEAVAESLPVPALSPVVKVSLEIATMAKEIKDTKDGMHSLAQYVARTTNAIYGTLDSFEDPRDAQINDRLDALLSTLQKIQAFMLRARDKNYLQRLWHKSEYEDQLTSLTKELEEAVETFQIQGSIRTEDQLCSVRRTQVVLLQHADDARRVDSELLRYFRNTETRLVQLSNQVANNATYDGTMRLFGRDDLELIEELDPESPIEESGERPVRYKARLRSSGSLVVVQRFPRSDDKFRDEVNIGKSIWHPNVAHPIGYSKSDPHTAFIVIDGSHTRTFNELSRTFHGADKMKWMMKAVRIHTTMAGLVYLSSVRDKLGWSPDDITYPMLAEKELLVSVDGRVLLDPSCYRLDRLPNTIIYDDGVRPLYGDNHVMALTQYNCR
ncbi:hypothetical protein L226DRAFT_468657 [Lentinus tigrinus ALCF2SS1-7]|uniref:uncharacterized protein n=1 Tax=Lentinus tigrinus ALCF2SS1-7 TaxID=1328758 RepID=UPI001165DAD0|nr:hypothetical protein L226DRAFT_468657 [Lentinus tigrinus ALCF2SS1-7]